MSTQKNNLFNLVYANPVIIINHFQIKINVIQDPVILNSFQLIQN